MPVADTFSRGSVLLVAAHPDDETVGAGAMLPRIPQVTVVHVTDGAPRDPSDAIAAGFATRDDYARARRRELCNALELAGVAPSALVSLDFVDQEASLDLAYATLRLVDVLRELRPDFVLTHPYEGGHPDHDAVAFSAHAACALSDKHPEVWEFTSYHSADPHGAPQIETGLFLDGDPGEAVVLCEADRALKRNMTECFTTQQHMLRHFPLDRERYRPAPSYDFTEAPHAGRLYYENFPWGMSGERWRDLAASAASNLGLPSLL